MRALVPAILFAACAQRLPPASVNLADDVRIGIRYQHVGPGLVVTEVAPSMGAARAGLPVGGLIVAIDGAPVEGARSEVQGRLRGEAGTTVRLTVRGPLDLPERDIVLERGLRRGAPPSDPPPAVVSRFRTSLISGRPGAIRRATRALVAADFGGLTPEEAIGSRLRSALRRSHRHALAAVSVLDAAGIEDAGVLLSMGEVLERAGDPAGAARLLGLADRSRPPDVLVSGMAGDVGGNPRGRSMLAEALWKTGERDAAIAVVRDLTRTWRSDALAATVGLALPPESPPWRAPLTPLPELELALLDGTSWRLSQHRDRVVIISFWATWCGPCRQELPALARLHQRLQGQGLEVLGVSVDEASQGAAVAKMATELSLPFPVAHAPNLSGQFDVRAIPALRLVGRDGSVQYRAEGYSERTMVQLEGWAERALAASAEDGSVLGVPGGSAEASLRAFFSVPGLRGLVAGDDGFLVGVLGAAPAVLGFEGSRLAGGHVLETEGEASQRVAWLDGPVSGDPGSWWVRALDADFGERWLLTLPSPLVDLAVVDGVIWVAAENELLALATSGQVLGRTPAALADLAPGEGAVWGAGPSGVASWTLGVRGPEAIPAPMNAAGEAPAGDRVSRHGAVAAAVGDLVTGRFGPAGELRAVVARPDGTVVGIDGSGEPVFTLRLSEPPGLAAVDLDEDAHDELVLALRGQGIAVVDLTLR